MKALVNYLFFKQGLSSRKHLIFLLILASIRVCHKIVTMIGTLFIAHYIGACFSAFVIRTSVVKLTTLTAMQVASTLFTLFPKRHTLREAVHIVTRKTSDFDGHLQDPSLSIYSMGCFNLTNCAGLTPHHYGASFYETTRLKTHSLQKRT